MMNVFRLNLLNVLFDSLVLTVFQVVTLIVINDLLIDVLSGYRSPTKAGIGWGIAIYFSAYFMTATTIVINILTFSIGRNKFYLIQLASFAVFAGFHLPLILEKPYRTLILLCAAFIGVLLPAALVKISLYHKHENPNLF